MYAIFDTAVDSVIPLPELPPASGGENRVIRIEWVEAPPPPGEGWAWHHWRDRHGTVTASCARLGGHYLLALPGVATFVIDPAGGLIGVDAPAELAPSTLRHGLLDQVIPMCLGQLGRQVLHASAVRLADGRVLGFVGESGLGKSTLAAAFAAAGASILTDDCLLIEPRGQGFAAIGNYPGMRLNEDSATRLLGGAGEPGSVAHHSAKSRLPAPGPTGPTGADALSALFLLVEPGGDDALWAAPLLGVEDLLPLITQHFYLDVADKALLRTRFGQLQRLLEARLPLFRLTYPRRFERLPEVIDTILHQLPPARG
ncbi:MAG: hypothetical protein WDA10_11935 [Porticoccaceae bacterium]|jgi:hypothetical protein|nr:hypothetical protein [Porticoccaceae bacterium]